VASRESYDPATKAAVMTALLAGQAVGTVARQYDIPIGTVKSWKSRQLNETIIVDTPEKKAEIGDLLLEYLRESLHTMIEQARHFRNLEWLREQSAESIGVLHGIQMDKLMRIVEALERAESAD
jgi:transposase-like protein